MYLQNRSIKFRTIAVKWVLIIIRDLQLLQMKQKRFRKKIKGIILIHFPQQLTTDNQSFRHTIFDKSYLNGYIITMALSNESKFSTGIFCIILCWTSKIHWCSSVYFKGRVEEQHEKIQQENPNFPIQPNDHVKKHVVAPV